MTRRKGAEQQDGVRFQRFQGKHVIVWSMRRQFLGLTFLEDVEKVVEMFGYDILIYCCRAGGLHFCVGWWQRHRRFHFPNGYGGGF